MAVPSLTMKFPWTSETRAPLHRGAPFSLESGTPKGCADRMSTGPGCIREERREALHPAVDGDVVDLDAALAKEFLDVAV